MSLADEWEAFLEFLRDCWWLLAMCIIAFGGLALIVYLAIQSEAKWQIFVQENGCKVVETIPGTVGTSTGVAVGTGSNGQVTVTPVVTTTVIPDRNKWVCRDESVHWK